MPLPEHITSPHDLYEDDVQGHIYSREEGIPGRRSLHSRQILHSVGAFKNELRRPDIRELVDNLHDQGFVVGAKAHASEIIFDIAQHKKAIAVGSIAAAGSLGAYHFFRRRKRQ